MNTILTIALFTLLGTLTPSFGNEADSIQLPINADKKEKIENPCCDKKSCQKDDSKQDDESVKDQEKG